MFTLILFAQAEGLREPGYFAPIVLGMLLLGMVGWLVAAVLGFARARAFGASARWFSFAAVFLILFHLQFVALGFSFLTKDDNFATQLLTFFNVFVILAAFCAIMGFIRLTSPR